MTTADRPVRVGVVAGRDSDGVYRVPGPYVDRISAAGALPLIISYVAEAHLSELATCIDGVLLTGGGDIAAHHLGLEQDAALRNIDDRRDRFELSLLQLVLDTDMPVLGICRGAQVLNVAAGGSLVLDIDRDLSGALRHDIGTSELSHPVDIAPGTDLRRLTGADTAMVNSAHHQSIGKVADGFRACASAPDGVIEAIEAASGPFRLGIQWHPEALDPAAAVGGSIFDVFVTAIRQPCRP